MLVQNLERSRIVLSCGYCGGIVFKGFVCGCGGALADPKYIRYVELGEEELTGSRENEGIFNCFAKLAAVAATLNRSISAAANSGLLIPEITINFTQECILLNEHRAGMPNNLIAAMNDYLGASEFKAV